MSQLISLRQRFGIPQLMAALLLLAFVAQCTWLAGHMPITRGELAFFSREQIQPGPDSPLPAAPALNSPVTSAAASAVAGIPFYLLWPNPPFPPETKFYAARLPFLLFGTLLGASVWYVARRLYGNAGGYIALTLYAFSPAIILRSATIQPDIGAAWGAFGCIFTGIAVAHTLYAPREVVLWNWRRIVLLGVAIAIGLGSHFAVVTMVPVVLALMLYLVPHRRGAAVTILAAACGVAFALLALLCGFRLRSFLSGAAEAGWHTFRPGLLTSTLVWRLLGSFMIRDSPGLVVLLAIALMTFAIWPRCRFFGTAAPLIVAGVLVFMAVTLPHAAGLSFLIIALPFAFVFVAGVFADLLEARHRALVMGAVTGVLLAHALSSVVVLATTMAH